MKPFEGEAFFHEPTSTNTSNHAPASAVTDSYHNYKFCIDSIIYTMCSMKLGKV